MEKVSDNLRLQLSEVEMLQSMYPSKQEFHLEDAASLDCIRAFIDGDLPYKCLDYRIGFVVCLQVDRGSIEVVCHLPHEYPTEPPEIFTRLPPCITRELQKSFTENLNMFIDTTRGDICIGSVLEWIKENIDHYLTKPTIEVKLDTTKKPGTADHDATFVRLWIYSHHIFSKFKRRDIIDIAEELKLSGFSVPGKPGLICVEGPEEDADLFWNRIRRMSWKKLAIKEREDVKVDSLDDIAKFRKFTGFEEKAFDVRGGKGREYHMDLGMVYNFLESVGCGHIFSLYFGVEGRSSEK